jgi:5'-nucleotidase
MPSASSFALAAAQTLETLTVIVTRRVLATVLIALLLAAGCSSDHKPAASSAPGSSSPAAASGGATLTILVSNDDGVAAPGIDALVKALTAQPDNKVTVVAPATNQSGTGGKTTDGPVTATPATTISGYPATSVAGYPADAVVYGLTTVLTSPPDLVMTGVNAGQNIGPLIDLSGTVGAARAAAARGVPAVAVSAGLGNPIDFTSGVNAALAWLHDHRAALLNSHAAPTNVANLNTPTCTSGAIRGEATTTADLSATTADALATPDCTSTAPAPSTDVAAFHDGFTSLSDVPIQPAATGTTTSTLPSGAPPPQAGEPR